MKRESTDPHRERLPGNSLFCGLSAEAVEGWGHESDSAFHALVAANVAMNLTSGFRGMSATLPVWFEYGHAHVVSRRVDERYTLYARGTIRDGADSWKWEQRVAGLVSNNFAPTWRVLADERRFEDLSGPDHLTAWSKVAWMLEKFGPDGMRTYLLAVTDPLPRKDELDRHTFQRDREIAVLAEIGLAPIEALEEEWLHSASKATSKR